jgi:uncharacterized membrane-anchored protein
MRPFVRGSKSQTHEGAIQTAVVTGALLAILAIVHQVTQISDVLMFWGVLWAGLVSATVSLWAALYRPPQSARVAE